MTKRLNNPTTYEINTNRAHYAVSLDRIKNGINGNPRFEAIVTVLSVHGQTRPEGSFFSARYRFDGHYYTEIEEAREIVKVYEKGLR